MTTPTRGAVHINGPLTQLSIAYMQDATQFVAGRVFPNVSVDFASDSYYIFNKDDWLRDEAEDRAPGAESAGSGFRLSTDTYNCVVKAFHKDLAWQTIANADSQLNLEQSAAMFVTQKMLLKKEKQFVSSYMKTGVWTKDVAGVAPGSFVEGTNIIKWSDYTNSNPITDVSYYATFIAQRTGFRPNKLVMGRDVWDKLKNHPDILDRVNGGATTVTPAMVTKQQVAALFEIDEILVTDAIENTAGEALTGAYSFISAGAMLLVYSSPAPGMMMPSGGYTFSWDRYLNGAAENGVSISTFEMRHLNSDRIEGEIAYDMKVTGSDLGVYFSAVL